MEITIFALLILGVIALYAASYLAKSLFFSGIATILLIITSFFALDLGLQYVSGQTSTIVDLVETIDYTYTEIEIGTFELSNIMGIGGLLLGLYFMSTLMISMFGSSKNN